VDAGLLILVGMFVLFWMLLIRPQRRRQRAQEEMVAGLRIGDEIVTAGGIYGEITALADDEVQVEIADGVEIRVARRAVAGVMPDEDEEDVDVDEVDEEEEPPEEEQPEEAGPASERQRGG
jgi:preprotein translocase subunit YajC